LQFTPYTLPTLASGLISLAAAYYVWRMRPRPAAASEFVGVALSVALMSFAYAAELTAVTVQGKLAWLQVRWIGIVSLPVLALALALRWGGHARRMTRSRWMALSVVPAATLLLAWSNPWHHLMASDSSLVPREGFVMRTASSGPLFYVFVLYAYACTLALILVYARALFWSPLHRRQAATLLVASILPLAANAVYVFGADVLFDVTQIGYGAACLCWAWGLRRDRLFELVPVARAQVVDSLTDAVLVVGADSRMLDANPAAAQLFGKDARLVGASLGDLVGGDIAAGLMHGASVSLLGRAFEIHSASVGDGAAARVLTFRDITARRELEAAREEALRLAEEAGEARARFLARMSHEVRGPLHGISGSAELLLGSTLDAGQRRYAEAVAASAASLLSLVNELLDFSKLDARRVSLQLADVDARAAAEDVVRMFLGAAERKRIELVLEPAAPLAVRADAERLKQVLINLVGNAVKFTDRGGITVRLVGEGELARIEVEDTGIGISASAHERIFQPFVQADAAPGGRPEGTGLGLAIARQLVELMGGRMGVASKPGEGSRFWLELRGTSAPLDARAPRLPAPATRPRRGKVLLVDDNEVHRLVSAGLLAREGCDVVEAESGPAGLQAYGGGGFALIVTDVRMPGMDGYAFAEALRAAGARVPVLALTGDVYDGAAAAARRAGMDDWLAKPVEPSALRATLDRWLPQDAPAGTPVAPAPAADLAEYLRAEPALFVQMCEAFSRTVPRESAAIVAGARAGRWNEVRSVAHGMKSAARIAGAAELEALARRLEQARGAESLADAERLPQAAQRALEALARTELAR